MAGKGSGSWRLSGRGGGGGVGGGVRTEPKQTRKKRKDLLSYFGGDIRPS